MGKIKGWTKTRDSFDSLEFESNDRSGDSLVATRLLYKTGYEWGLYIFENGNTIDLGNGKHNSKIFKFKYQVKDYAMRYMRTHPRG